MTIANTELMTARQTELDRLHRLFPNQEVRMLSALGHPGYSDAFARTVLGLYVTTTDDLHSIVRDAIQQLTTKGHAMTINMPASSLAGIETRYLGPTNHRGSRIKAMRSEHKTGDPTVTVGYDYSLNSFENHAEAARQLAEQYGWDGDYVAAATERGYIFARVAR